MEKFYWFIIFISLNSLILVGLAGYVSKLRLKYKISFGDGGNKHLLKAMRTHSNGTEQVPIFALIILSFTLLDYSQTIIAILVMLFTLARLSHAVGMLLRVHIFRQIGATVTYLLQIIGPVMLLIKVII